MPKGIGRVTGESGRPTVAGINKPGPTALMTTSTRRLGDQLMSRLFTVDVPDDHAQVQAALTAQASPTYKR